MKEKYLSLVRRSYRMLKHKRLRDRPWWRAMTKPLFNRALWIPCRDTVAAGLAIGMFFSMILVLPFQMFFAAVLAMRFRVNIPFAMAACWASNFFTNPLFLIAQMAIGDWMRNSLGFPMPAFPISTKSLSSLWWMPQRLCEMLPANFNAGSLFLGMMVSAVLVALASYTIVHLFSAIMPHHLPVLKRRVKPVEKAS